MKKRILPALLALAMVLTMLPMAAFAETPTNVAKVGDTEYATLGEAVTAANDSEITLLADATVSETAEYENVNIDTATFSIVVAESGVLTLKGSNTKIGSKTADNTDHKPSIKVCSGGTLNIEDGAYETTSAQFLYIEGTANVKGGTFTTKHKATNTTGTDGRAFFAVDGTDSQLNMTAGTIQLVQSTNSEDNNSVHPIGLHNGGTAVLGEEGTDGPTVLGGYQAISVNNLQSPANLTIKSGTYKTQWTAQNVVSKWDAVVYCSAKGLYTIEGGTFTPTTGNGGGTAKAAVFSVPYTNAGANLAIGDGTFEGDKLFYIGNETGGGASGTNKEEVSGGTFSAPVDPEYLAVQFEAVNGEGKYSYHADQTAAEAAAGPDGTVSKKSEDGTAMEPIIKIKATGFIWDKDDEAKIAEAEAAGVKDHDDWVDQTIWVAFDQALPAGAHYWFDVEINGETYGIAANGDGTHKAQAFSFLNPGQWEVPPTELLNEDGTGLKDEFTGSDMTATITVYKTATQLSQAPTDDEKAQLEKVGEPTTVTVPAKPANANPNLKITDVTPDVVGFAKAKVSGMIADKTYVIRLAKSSSLDSDSIILVVTGVTEYEFTCKVGQKAYVLEFNSKVDLQGVMGDDGKLHLAPTSELPEHAVAKVQ